MNLEDLVAAEDDYNIIESMHRSTSEITFICRRTIYKIKAVELKIRNSWL